MFFQVVRILSQTDLWENNRSVTFGSDSDCCLKVKVMDIPELTSLKEIHKVFTTGVGLQTLFNKGCISLNKLGP